MRITILTLAGAFLGVACAGARGGQSGGAPMPMSEPQAATDTVAQGVVVVTGADPFAQVVARGAAGDVALTGALREELATLHGAEVRVRGRPMANRQPRPARAVEVTSYEIVAINGERPYVGELAGRDGGLWLHGMRLAGASDELRGAVGAKVWVLGRRADGELQVLSYGIIARPPR